ncbi:MAG TPA: YafY family protein [Burkholderiaceae bacterium]
MYHPTTRVLAVLEQLQANGHVSGAELAQRLAVDTRTVRRYIATLEELGIPIVTERGRYGGYALVPGFKLPPMMFTDDEALALSVGLLAARGLGLSEAAPAVASVQAKLERIMPGPLKQRVRAIAATVRLDLERAIAPGDNAALVVLSAAALARQRVRLSYRTPDGASTERAFDTYGLAFRSGCWYAVGWCHLRAAVRSFRLDRIEHARPLPASFAPPDDFDALAELRRAIAGIPREHQVEVLLHTDLQTAVAAFSEAIGVFEQTGEGVLLRSQTGDLAWFARHLASAPFDFAVRSPPALRGEVAALAERLARLSRAG